MSSYGHPRPPYGPGDYGESDGYEGYDSYDRYADSYAADSYGRDPYPADPYAEPPTRPTPAGRAAAAGPTGAGRAAAGRARVAASAAVAPPPAPPVEQEEPGHRYDWSGAGRQRPAAGRASVPVSPAVGGVSGRATVKPTGPGGPAGPAGTGPGGGGDDGGPKRKKKRHWIRNTMLSALAVIVISTGGGMVALSYYVESVPPPELLELEEGSTVYYAGGQEMAVLQEVNREIIDTTVPELENVRTAVVAAEDKGFFDHSGVDFLGIVRAAWNNFTGGPPQGASTIDQQYAGAAANIRGEATYSRKLQEAAMAYKMNQDYSKEEILDFYLNQIYFGRGAYGIQAAAKSYFDKDATELTLEEASVLAGCIRLPDDGTGLCPYDPLHTPDDPSAAEFRFRYVLGQAVEMGKLDQPTADAMVLPEVIEPPDPNEPFKGAQGNIVRHVENELREMGIEDVSTGGYRITTTISRGMQKAAREAARRKSRGPLWEGMPENVAAAMVAVDPETGGVLAYYGGDDGTGIDLAGPNDDEFATGRPAGSTMKVYTLLAALREGVPLDSHWKTTPFDPEWIDGNNVIENAGRGAATDCEGEAPDFCTLRWSTIQSFNTPFAYFAERVPDGQGAARILQAAADAGIRTITGDDGVVYDLTSLEDVSEITRSPIDYPIAYGQYAITVLDHASGMATIAAHGVYHEPHFVSKVEKKENGEWVTVRTDQIAGEQRIEAAHADAVTGVLSQIPTSGMMGNNALANDRPAAAKTGTWEYIENGFINGNRDAWVVGYTPQIATAVWVGDPLNGKIVDQFGNDIGSNGLPAQIWKQFMDAAHELAEHEIVPFPPAPQPGDPNSPIPNGVRPEPDPSDDPRCRNPIVQLRPAFCNDGDDGDDDDGNNNGNNGGNNGGGLLPLPPPLPGPPDQGG